MRYFKTTEFAESLHVEFHDPESSNALSLLAARELTALQKRMGAVKKPIVVTSGHPRLFCSGGQLNDYQKLKTKAAGLKVNREITSHIRRFAAWPVVKVALIEGDVLGGGMEWLGAFDFRWTTPDVLLSFWQRRMGLSPGWGGGALWASRIPESSLRQLILSAELISAQKGLRLGLVDRIESSATLRVQVQAWLKNQNPTVSHELAGWRVRLEATHFRRLWLGTEHRQALARWNAKPAK